MLMDNNIFTIDISTSHSDLANAHKDILKNIDKIEFKVSNENAWEVGLACGGELSVFLEKIN